MAWIRFTQGHKIIRPMVSIYPSGQIAVNKLCFAKYGLEQYGYAVLYYDKEKRMVALQFTNDKKQDGAYSVRKRSGGAADISGRAFLKYWDIKHDKTRRYEPEFCEPENMLVIKL